MHRILFLAIFLDQQSSSANCIRSGTVDYKTVLFRRNRDDAANSAVNDASKYLSETAEDNSRKGLHTVHCRIVFKPVGLCE